MLLTYVSNIIFSIFSYLEDKINCIDYNNWIVGYLRYILAFIDHIVKSYEILSK